MSQVMDAVQDNFSLEDAAFEEHRMRVEEIVDAINTDCSEMPRASEQKEMARVVLCQALKPAVRQIISCFSDQADWQLTNRAIRKLTEQKLGLENGALKKTRNPVLSEELQTIINAEAAIDAQATEEAPADELATAEEAAEEINAT